jgi:hypothetical protein
MTVPQHIPGLLDLKTEQLEELKKAKRSVRSILEGIYGSCMFVEHGHHGHLRDEEHCSHAHLHVLPIAVDLHKIFRERHYREEVADYGAVNYIANEYMFFENAMGESSFYRVEPPPEKRFTRRVILKEIGQPQERANWEEFRRPDVIADTRLKLKKYF